MDIKIRKMGFVFLSISFFFFSFPKYFRSTTWWFCLQTGPMWRMPAECKNMRTSSRRRSRSSMTSTPLAPRNVLTLTRKRYNVKPGPASPASFPLSLFSCRLSLCHPLPREADGTSGPCHLWCHRCVIRQCDLERTSYKPLQSHTAIQIFKNKPCYLSHCVLQ